MKKKVLILILVLLITSIGFLLAQNHKSVINKTLSVFIQNENTLEMPDYPITTPLPVYENKGDIRKAETETISPYTEFINDN